MLGGAVQISLLAVALIDIFRRPQEEIRGNKVLCDPGGLHQLCRSNLLLPVRPQALATVLPAIYAKVLHNQSFYEALVNRASKA